MTLATHISGGDPGGIRTHEHPTFNRGVCRLKRADSKALVPAQSLYAEQELLPLAVGDALNVQPSRLPIAARVLIERMPITGCIPSRGEGVIHRRVAGECALLAHRCSPVKLYNVFKWFIATFRNSCAGGAISSQRHPSSCSANAELLAVCARLADHRAQWQSRWAATPDVPDGGPQDTAFDEFSQNVWPGYRCADPVRGDDTATDLPALLLTLPATTAEGLQAKAAAVLAISDAGSYTGDSRLDEIELLRSVVRDATGDRYQELTGEAA